MRYLKVFSKNALDIQCQFKRIKFLRVFLYARMVLWNIDAYFIEFSNILYWLYVRNYRDDIIVVFGLY